MKIVSEARDHDGDYSSSSSTRRGRATRAGYREKKIHDVSARAKVNKDVARVVAVPRNSPSNQSYQAAKSRVRTAKGMVQDPIESSMKLFGCWFHDIMWLSNTSSRQRADFM